MPSPDRWGPVFWRLLHYTAYQTDQVRLHAPQLSQQVEGLFVELLDELQWILPCFACRQHYVQFLRAHNLGVDIFSQSGTPEAATAFVWTLHNWVNAELGKPGFPLDRLRKTVASIQFGPNELAFLIKTILADDICNPNTPQAQFQKQQQMYMWPPAAAVGAFETQDNMQTCIAAQQIGRFERTLGDLFDTFSRAGTMKPAAAQALIKALRR